MSVLALINLPSRLEKQWSIKDSKNKKEIIILLDYCIRTISIR